MGQSVSLSLYYADKMLYLAGKDAYMDSKIKVPVPTDDSGDADEETAALLEEKIKPKLEKILESAAVVEKGGDAQVTLSIPDPPIFGIWRKFWLPGYRRTRSPAIWIFPNSPSCPI